MTPDDKARARRDRYETSGARRGARITIRLDDDLHAETLALAALYDVHVASIIKLAYTACLRSGQLVAMLDLADQSAHHGEQ